MLDSNKRFGRAAHRAEVPGGKGKRLAEPKFKGNLYTPWRTGTSSCIYPLHDARIGLPFGWRLSVLFVRHDSYDLPARANNLEYQIGQRTSYAHNSPISPNHANLCSRSKG